MKFLISVLFLVQVSFACLPTQQVEPTTTTTVAPYPCSVCQPLYIDDCSDGGLTCVLSSLFGVVYKMGPLLDFPWPFGDANTCSTYFNCPIGTVPYVKYPIVNTYAPAPLAFIIAVCSETGPDAGKWFYGFTPLTVPIAINGITCQGVFSG